MEGGSLMARIRTIKPSFWSDDDVAGLSRDARLLMVGLISMADDEGRFVATKSAICGYVFPYDNIGDRTFQGWMAQIADRGIIQLYEAGGRPYGWFPKWEKHQRINRPSESTFPAPHSLNGSWNKTRSES